MTSVLALDPAWTVRQPSGVALLTETNGRWRCAGLAPSYGQFVALAERAMVDWDERPLGGAPDVDAILDTATRLLAQHAPEVVMVDMPVSRLPISARRESDNAVSRVYGSRGCATHSPSLERPGSIGQNLTDEFGRRGYAVATTTTPRATPRVLCEVYPHPALLSLLHENYRLEYKIGHAASYWRDERPLPTLEERKRRIVQTWRRIYDELAKSISSIPLLLPPTERLGDYSLATLKRYEDALDALICGWVGIRYLQGLADPYGDEHAAIWIPK